MAQTGSERGKAPGDGEDPGVCSAPPALAARVSEADDSAEAADLRSFRNRKPDI